MALACWLALEQMDRRPAAIRSSSALLAAETIAAACCYFCCCSACLQNEMNTTRRGFRKKRLLYSLSRVRSFYSFSFIFAHAHGCSTKVCGQGLRDVTYRETEGERNHACSFANLVSEFIYEVPTCAGVARTRSLNAARKLAKRACTMI